MVELAEASGVRTSARITWMGRPLGRAVGHALEVEESRAALRGEGPPDLEALVEAFAVDLAVSSGVASDEEAALALARERIASGAAAERFERMLRAQGATGEALPEAPDVHELKARSGGILGFGDVREVGLAVRELGGGRSAPSDAIDPAVGVVWERAAGDRVDAGDLLCRVHHRGGRAWRRRSSASNALCAWRSPGLPSRRSSSNASSPARLAEFRRTSALRAARSGAVTGMRSCTGPGGGVGQPGPCAGRGRFLAHAGVGRHRLSSARPATQRCATGALP